MAIPQMDPAVVTNFERDLDKKAAEYDTKQKPIETDISTTSSPLALNPDAPNTLAWGGPEFNAILNNTRYQSNNGSGVKSKTGSGNGNGSDGSPDNLSLDDFTQAIYQSTGIPDSLRKADPVLDSTLNTLPAFNNTDAAVLNLLFSPDRPNKHLEYDMLGHRFAFPKYTNPDELIKEFNGDNYVRLTIDLANSASNNPSVTLDDKAWLSSTLAALYSEIYGPLIHDRMKAQTSDKMLMSTHLTVKQDIDTVDMKVLYDGDAVREVYCDNEEVAKKYFGEWVTVSPMKNAIPESNTHIIVGENDKFDDPNNEKITENKIVYVNQDDLVQRARVEMIHGLGELPEIPGFVWDYQKISSGIENLEEALVKIDNSVTNVINGDTTIVDTTINNGKQIRLGPSATMYTLNNESFVELGGEAQIPFGKDDSWFVGVGAYTLLKGGQIYRSEDFLFPFNDGTTEYNPGNADSLALTGSKGLKLAVGKQWDIAKKKDKDVYFGASAEVMAQLQNLESYVIAWENMITNNPSAFNPYINRNTELLDDYQGLKVGLGLGFQITYERVTFKLSGGYELYALKPNIMVDKGLVDDNLNQFLTNDPYINATILIGFGKPKSNKVTGGD